MSSKKGQAVSEENLEKASGGKILKTTLEQKLGPKKTKKVTEYNIINDGDYRYMGTVYDKDEAKRIDKAINSKK